MTTEQPSRIRTADLAEAAARHRCARIPPIRMIKRIECISLKHQAHAFTREPKGFAQRLSRFGGDLSKTTNSGILEWHRFGHFHYLIPVATGAKYTVKLYFFEHWFGAQNGGVGGAGSRVFDVSCNGSVLLKDFDIYREAGSEPLVKTFNGIEPTAQGKIELYFTPSVNYPSISAIEVIPE